MSRNEEPSINAKAMLFVPWNGRFYPDAEHSMDWRDYLPHMPCRGTGFVLKAKPMRPNLHLEIDKHKRLREELLSRWPALSGDETALDDTLEGASTLPEAIAAVLRSRREDIAFVEALAAQIKQMEARKARLAERADRKKSLALWAMTEGDIKRVDAPDLAAWTSMSQAKVIIPDEKAIPIEYMRVKYEPHKKLIGAALRAGEKVIGASLGNPQPTIVVKDS
jgi:hypothetical protein